jgi:hypothetical protein
MTTSPRLDEFLACARREYRFLVDDFGFAEATQSHNPFEVDYTSDSLLVAVEGINWGFGVQILLTPLRSGSPLRRESVPLWSIARLRSPEELEQSHQMSGQLALLACYAQILRSCASDVLRGDFSIFPVARDVVAQEAARSREPKKPFLP